MISKALEAYEIRTILIASLRILCEIMFHIR